MAFTRAVLSLSMLLAVSACMHAMAQPTSTSRVEIAGDYAGRAMKVKIDGRIEYEGKGQLAPTGVSWFIGTGPGNDSATLRLEIAPCEKAFVTGIPRDGKDHTVVVDGCNIRLLE